MSEDKNQAMLETPTVTALNGIAEAINRFTDAYLYCNAPDEEGEPQHEGQSLSDPVRRYEQGLDGIAIDASVKDEW